MASLFAIGCGSEPPVETTPEPKGTVVRFDLDSTLADTAFFDFPMPSDLRLTENGTPDVGGFPNPKKTPLVDGVKTIAGQRHGYPVIPVGYFRFTDEMAPLDAEKILPADIEQPLWLIDIDRDSPERGRLFPVVATTPPVDGYTPQNLVAIAPRPGFILKPLRTYAFVVKRSLGDAAGKTLDVADVLEQLAAGETPEIARGEDMKFAYAPLWETLDLLKVPHTDIAAATVFTTGDVVAELSKMGSALKPKHPITITDLALDPDDGATHERFCELHGKVKYPQFQKGDPPFDTEGLFETDSVGLPIKQRDEEAPIAIAIPKMPMPAGGYPLVTYFHGSGGLSTQFIDRGKVPAPDAEPEKGKGPAHELAFYGIASAGSALPVNPERLPGAEETEYLNVNNLAAMRDTFRQGVIEQRLFIEALKNLEIDPGLLAACAGPTLPAGETQFRFSEKDLLAQGQSMGGMYTNMIGSTEPRIRAVVPTGAGGFWTYFILKTSLIDGLPSLVAIALLQTNVDLTFMHPAMHLAEMGLEPADPFVYMPRLGRNPLQDHPVRPVYEPVGKGDSYFPTVLYDAIAVAYNHQQAGDLVWPEMQDALALDGLDGLLSYPVSQNRKSLDGTEYTGVVVQYEGDGFYDPHGIYGQLDQVKYQYGCFFDTFLKTGTAEVLAPKPLGSPCE